MTVTDGSFPIFVIEDDAAVRGSLCALLDAHGHAALPCATAEDFLERFDPNSATIIILDLRLPGMNGIELQTYLNEIDARTAIIIITAHGDVPIAVNAIRAGAIDFIEKPSDLNQVLQALELAQASLFNSSVAAVPRQVISERKAKLTDRENQVLERLLQGKLNKEIADELGISRRTVEVHRARVREKMHARGIADLIRMFN